MVLLRVKTPAFGDLGVVCLGNWVMDAADEISWCRGWMRQALEAEFASRGWPCSVEDSDETRQ